MPRNIREVSDTHSGYVNVESKTGVRLWQLEKTEAFESYDLRNDDLSPNPWMPIGEWNGIMQDYFGGADVFLKELAAQSPYTDWRSLKRAITRAGSCMHFHQDGPLWVTTQNSGAVGIDRVVQVGNKAEQGGWFQINPMTIKKLPTNHESPQIGRWTGSGSWSPKSFCENPASHNVSSSQSKKQS